MTSNGNFIDRSRISGNNKEIFDKVINKVTITIYENGFIINDEDFRDISEIENKDFIYKLNNNQIPNEFLKFNDELGIVIIDKRYILFIKDQ